MRGGACTTTGSVPTGATRITQSATTASGASSFALGFARSKAKTATGKCRITSTGTKAKRTYTCTIRLSKGTWTVTTKALSKTTVVAQSVSTRTLPKVAIGPIPVTG